MSLDRRRVRRSRGRLALGVGLTAAVLGCGGAFVHGQISGTSSPRADATDQTVGEPAKSVEATQLLEMDTEITLELAETFGVEPYQLMGAVNSVRAGQVHYGGSTDESAAGRHRALADALGLDPRYAQDTFGMVTAGDSAREDSERFIYLVECLDEAVKEGQLSELDRESVLKVHELGLLKGVQ